MLTGRPFPLRWFPQEQLLPRQRCQSPPRGWLRLLMEISTRSTRTSARSGRTSIHSLGILIRSGRTSARSPAPSAHSGATSIRSTRTSSHSGVKHRRIMPLLALSGRTLAPPGPWPISNGVRPAPMPLTRSSTSSSSKACWVSSRNPKRCGEPLSPLGQACPSGRALLIESLPNTASI